MNELDVWLNQSRAGRLSHRRQQHGFTYSESATEAISLTMPLRTETYVYEQGLHPVFQMNLPEGYLRQALERHAVKQFGSDDLHYLALLGNHQIGRLRYTATDHPLADDTLAPPSLASLLHSDDAQLFQQLFERYAFQSGIAGVQPKFLLSTQADITNKATLPLKNYIVKGWGDEFPELACNEFFCLSLARSAGLTLPNFYLSDNGKLLIAERFDINEQGNPFGFEDFCVLQGKTTRQKYDASLESCANTLVHFLSPELLQKSLYDFFKLTLVNIKIRNGDAHLKNIGIIYPNLVHYTQGDTPLCERRPAPIYDLVNTTAYLPQDTMALSLAGSKRWPTWKTLEKFAKTHCRLNSHSIEAALAEVENACQTSSALLNHLTEKHPGFTPIAETIHTLVSRSRL